MEAERICPGCGVRMPLRESATYDGYFHTSPECWSVFTEVIGAEFSNAFLFGRVHQLTVDTYAVQHAGGPHPDKSVDIHLGGLHLALVRNVQPTKIPPLLQRLAEKITDWPHLVPPDSRGSMTVFDVAMAGSVEEHIDLVRQWAASVWHEWSMHHADVADMITRYLGSIAKER